MKGKRLPLETLAPLFEEMFSKGGTVNFTVFGESMQPMLYNGRDTVILHSCDKTALKKYSLPLFRRDNGKFILHRIIKVNKDGTYTCRGDNEWTKEFSVRPDQIVGEVRSFVRNGKHIEVDKSIGYWLYTRTWPLLHYFKPLYKYIILPFKRNK